MKRAWIVFILFAVAGLAKAEEFSIDDLTLKPIYASQQAPTTGEAGGGSDSAELGKKLSNPVANLISVPFQSNYDEPFGAKDAYKLTLNVQPVIPFLSYTTPKATTIGINTESTYDWTGNQWTVPINLFVSQVVKFGKQPVQFTLGPRYYADSPDGGPEWGARFVMTFLFPK